MRSNIDEEPSYIKVARKSKQSFIHGHHRLITIALVSQKRLQVFTHDVHNEQSDAIMHQTP